MPYNLPHAVLALLQQEGSQPQPKAYFVRSSSKSTKITLVYSKRRRRGATTAYHNFSLPGSPNSSQDPLEDTQLYSTSCPVRNTAPTPVSPRTPYSAKQVLAESFTFPSRSVCPTETSTTTTSREGRGMSVRGRDGYEFNTTPDDDDDEDDDDDDDLNDHYIALSPSLYGDDIPLTPGRDFAPSESPRPPTPNIQNYNFLVGSGSKGLTTASPSRQATIEYDEGHFPTTSSHHTPETGNPTNENVRNEIGSNGRSSGLGNSSKSELQQRHSRPHKHGGNGDLNTGSSSSSSGNGNSKCNTPQQQSSSKRTSRPGPPITIQAPSPDNRRRRQQHDPQHRSHSDRRHDAEHAKMSSGSRPPYQRVASWDGARP